MIINFDKTYRLEDEVEKLSERSIYEYYLNTDIKPNGLIKCCFHKDKSPSLGFYRSQTNRLHFKCFGCGAQGAVTNFVMKFHNCGYGEALQILKKDFNLYPDAKTTVHRRDERDLDEFNYLDSDQDGSKKTRIIPVFRNFSKIDFDYWGQYYIPLDLLLSYDIHACSIIYVVKNGDYKVVANHTNSNPIYAYKIDDAYKIYKPYSPDKKNKWLANTTLWDVQGLKQLPESGDQLIITSSMKDVLVLKIMGYNAIALGGEGNHIPDKILDYLKAIFSSIIIFYDNDGPGIQYGQMMSERINCPYIHIPVEYEDTKDISDFIAKYGKEETECLLNTIL